jgi:hypothetical protein
MITATTTAIVTREGTTMGTARIAFLFTLFASQAFVFGNQKDVVHHPAPRQPIFLSISWYETLKKEVPPPPAIGSEAQALDETELLEMMRTRTKADCKQARAEMAVSLDTFFGPRAGLLTASQVKAQSAFFEQVRNDSDYFIQRLKKDFPRKRPFLYVNGVKPCVKKEVTMAYPSGHAVLSRLFALILSDQDPARATAYQTRADEIARHRVIAGMHHPSDIALGKKLADKIHAQLKRSPQFLEAQKASRVTTD